MTKFIRDEKGDIYLFSGAGHANRRKNRMTPFPFLCGVKKDECPLFRRVKGSLRPCSPCSLRCAALRVAPRGPRGGRHKRIAGLVREGGHEPRKRERSTLLDVRASRDRALGFLPRPSTVRKAPSIRWRATFPRRRGCQGRPLGRPRCGSWILYSLADSEHLRPSGRRRGVTGRCPKGSSRKMAPTVRPQ